MCVLTYWVVGVNRKANDFFIATEGEMKKVNWSTRAEVIRSTKVVIVTVVGGLGIFLLGMKNMSEGMQAVAGSSLRKKKGVSCGARPFLLGLPVATAVVY